MNWKAFLAACVFAACATPVSAQTDYARPCDDPLYVNGASAETAPTIFIPPMVAPETLGGTTNCFWYKRSSGEVEQLFGALLEPEHGITPLVLVLEDEIDFGTDFSDPRGRISLAKCKDRGSEGHFCMFDFGIGAGVLVYVTYDSGGKFLGAGILLPESPRLLSGDVIDLVSRSKDGKITTKITHPESGESVELEREPDGNAFRHVIYDDAAMPYLRALANGKGLGVEVTAYWTSEGSSALKSYNLSVSPEVSRIIDEFGDRVYKQFRAARGL